MAKQLQLLFLTHIFSETNQAFTSIMGGFFQNNPSNLIRTGEEFMLVEADEYDRSFLHLHPTVGAITSIDSDHLDVYQTKDAFEGGFCSLFFTSSSAIGSRFWLTF